MSNSIRIDIKTNDVELQKLKAKLRALAGTPRVKVGIVGKSASQKQGPISMPELAATHELGSPKRGIPERSFIRSAMDANRANYGTMLGPLLRGFLDGRFTIEKVLGVMGQKMQADVRGKIVGGPPLQPPLSAQTIAERKKRAQAKGSGTGKLRDSKGKFLSLKGVGNRPLVDTGQLVAAISYEVERKAGPNV